MTKAIKVLHINDVASVGTNLVSGLQSLGVEAALYNLSHGNVFHMPRMLWYLLAPFVQIREAFHIRQVYKAGNYSCTHVHYGSHAWISAIVNGPSYLHLHGSDIRRDYHWPGFKNMIESGSKKAVKLFYATPDLQSRVEKLRADAIYLPDPIDTQYFMPDPSENQKDRISILCVSKMDRTKGIPVLLPALDQIWESYPQVKVLLFGFGNDLESASYFFNKHSKNPNLTILSRMPHHQIANLIQSASIVIGQLELGSLGCSELEVMSCGKPLVAKFSYPNVYTELPPVLCAASSEQVRDQVIRLIEDEPFRKKIGAESRNWLVANHSIPVVAQKLYDVYLNTL